MMTVPEITLQQLGGRRFIAMTGAKHFTQSANCLTFKLPRGTKNNINCVQITLDPGDTYNVKFFRIRGVDMTLVSAHEDIYADTLRELFAQETGLATAL